MNNNLALRIAKAILDSNCPKLNNKKLEILYDGNSFSFNYKTGIEQYGSVYIGSLHIYDGYDRENGDNKIAMGYFHGLNLNIGKESVLEIVNWCVDFLEFFNTGGFNE